MATVACAALVRGMDVASLLPGFYSSRVTSAFIVDLYFGLPRVSIADLRTSGTSPVKLTNHFPVANPPTTTTLDHTTNRICRMADDPLRLESPCFTDSRGLALRLGRIVNPLRVLFPGSFDITF